MTTQPILGGTEHPISGSLSPKERAFVEHYVVNWCAAEAARQAGYKRGNAGQAGYELIARPRIQEAIRAAVEKRRTRLDLDVQDVIRPLLAIVNTTPDDVLDEMQSEDGKAELVLKPLSELTQEAKMALTIEVEGTSEDGRRKTKIKLADRLKAIELLGRYLGAWHDKRIESQLPAPGRHSPLEAFARRLTDDQLEQAIEADFDETS